MNFSWKWSGLAFCVACLFFSCQSEPKTPPTPPHKEGEPTQVIRHETQQIVSLEGAKVYTVTDCSITWYAKKAMGGMHGGYVKTAGGELKVKDGQLLAGDLTLDLNSLTVTDIPDAGERANLEKHLKDSDFFETKKYPTGNYHFDTVLPSKLPDFDHAIAGSLTLKGITNALNIPVKLKITDSELTAESLAFTIDRTAYGITYLSSNFGTLMDKAIENTVTLSLQLKAKAN